MALYLINKPFAEIGLDMAKRDDDAKVVLVQDGVYVDVSVLEGKKEILFIEADAQKRGVKDFPENAKEVSYEDLIDMIAEQEVYNFI